MGFYVNVIAANGMADTINKGWRLAGFSNWLIYTKAIIESEIAFIAKDPAQKGLRWVDTVEKWNNTFSIHAENRGQLFFRAYGYSESSQIEFRKERQDLMRQIRWIIQNKLWFKSINNLKDAQDALGMAVDCDGYVDGIAYRHIVPTFDDLPKEQCNRVFRACMATDNPGLWQAFVAWRKERTWGNWKALRSYTPPYKTHIFETIWQRVESMAVIRDGKHHGYTGRYRDGWMPPDTDVVRAILEQPVPLRVSRSMMS
jgi:hypothetical protein